VTALSIFTEDCVVTVDTTEPLDPDEPGMGVFESERVRLGIGEGRSVMISRRAAALLADALRDAADHPAMINARQSAIVGVSLAEDDQMPS
jgi:hypothetical protein